MPVSDGFATASDRRACREAIRVGSRSFYAASLLLPARVRRSALGLYAFCRVSDDAVDCEGGPAALTRLRARLDAAYAGRPPDHPADRAFADLIRSHQIPRALPEALLEGFAWDCEGRRYADIEALSAYAARVAGSVGAMMTLMMGVRDAATLARACDLGVAMQFTNIARDVGEDARAGRLYLPLDWLEGVGLDPRAFLAAPAPSPALAQVIARLLDEADRLYARARDGVARLPRDCRPAILAAARLYAEIGHEVARRDFDSITTRARTPGRRKLALIAGAVREAAALTRGRSEPPLAATTFLVEAVAQHRIVAPPARPSFEARFVRVLEIFERLQRTEQLGR